MKKSTHLTIVSFLLLLTLFVSVRSVLAQETTLTSCNSMTPPEGFTVFATTDNDLASPGQTISFHGSIKDSAASPISNGTLYAVVENTSAAAIKGNMEAAEVIGYFPVKDSITLNSNQSTSFNASWKIPDLATVGNYSITFLLVVNTKISLSDLGPGLKFSINYSDTKKQSAILTSANASTKDRVTSLTLGLTSTSAKKQNLLLTTTLFPWNITSIKTISSQNKTVTLAPITTTAVTFPVNNLPLPSATLFVHLVSTENASSTYILKLKNPTITTSRITAIGMTNFPLTDSSNSSAFICLEPTTFPEITKTKVTLDVVDSNGHSIKSSTYQYVASTTPAGVSVPLSNTKNYTNLSIKASVYKNGVLSDTATTSYNCENFPESGCGSVTSGDESLLSFWGKLLISLAALLIIIFTIFEWWKKRKNTKTIMTAIIFAFLFLGTIVPTSHALASSNNLKNNNDGFVNDTHYNVPIYYTGGDAAYSGNNPTPSKYIYEVYTTFPDPIDTNPSTYTTGGFWGHDSVPTNAQSLRYQGSSYPTAYLQNNTNAPGWEYFDPQISITRETIADIKVTSISGTAENVVVGDSLVPDVTNSDYNSAYNIDQQTCQYSEYCHPSSCSGANGSFTTAHLPQGSHILVTLNPTSVVMLGGSSHDTNMPGIMRQEISSGNLLDQPIACDVNDETWQWDGSIHGIYEPIHVATASKTFTGLNGFSCTQINSTQEDCVATTVGSTIPTVTFATTTAALFWSEDAEFETGVFSCRAITGPVPYFSGSQTPYASVTLPSSGYRSCAISIDPPAGTPYPPTIQLLHEGAGTGGIFVFSATATDTLNTGVRYQIDWGNDGLPDRTVSLSDTFYDANGNSVTEPNYDSNNPNATTTASGQPLDFNGPYSGGFNGLGTHTFHARTQNANGVFSDWAPFSVTVYPTPDNTDVFNVDTSSSCGGKFDLSWNPVTRATGYNLYDYDTGELLKSYDASTTNDTYTAPDMNTYHTYTLTTVASNGESQGQTNFGISSDSCDALPHIPQNFYVMQSTTCGGVLDMNWDKVSNATGYNIYRMNNDDYTFGSPIATVGSSTLSYSDTVSSYLTPYTYYVTAVNDNGESDPSNTNYDYSSDTCTPLPNPPANLSAYTADECGGKVFLSWDTVSDVNTYEIYKKAWNGFDDGSYELLAEVTGTTTYQDIADQSGYKYIVYSHNDNGDSTNPSPEAYAQGSAVCQDFVCGDNVCSFSDGENHDNCPADCRPECSDGIDNDNLNGVDAADLTCHTDSDASNPDSYDSTDNLEGAPVCTRDNIEIQSGDTHVFYKKKLVPFDSNCDANGNSSNLTCTNGVLNDPSDIYPYATCSRAPKVKEI